MANLSVLQHSSELEHVRPVKPSCTAQVRISVWDSQTVTESRIITSWFGLEGTFEDYLVQPPPTVTSVLQVDNRFYTQLNITVI